MASWRWLCGAWILSGAALWAGEWNEFRGPTGQGTSDAKGLPLTWSDTENVAWKVPVPGLGWSSPVVSIARSLKGHAGSN